MATRRSLLLTLAASAAALTACTRTSIWEARYEPSAPGADLRPIEQAKNAPRPAIRRVPWERLDATMTEFERELAASDTPREEWSPEQRTSVDAKLLRGLQVTQDPSAVTILGVTQFRTTDFDRPSDADLSTLAARAGGDTVVWSSRYLGQAERVVQEPVTTYSTWTAWYGRKGRMRTGTDTTTTWVPVRVQADLHEFVAFVLRVSP